MMAKAGEPLTRQKVLEVALQLVDQEGLEGFSMRKLGAMLGVEAMALYHHFENKRALFDGIIEHLIIRAPYQEPSNATPREELWAFAHAFRDSLRAHPRMLPLVATSPLRTPTTLAILDRLLQTMQRAQVTGIQAIYALQCLVGFIIGHTLIEMGPLAVAGLEPGPNGPAVWQQFPAEHYPTLHALLPEIAQWKSDHEFDFGLKALFQSLFEQ
ncbi:TetR family transcriptional regulator [Ktedonosporobacter rubrisoli]|uniref:TetR family transcriptional regulator n=1 Tax=Ktedonosporobacter rubrisoli TaxID=2509675 RepID=A0A4P6JI95_KTERU|nr:TetR/AcrR family transcriptional regulator C-terminal domain-containing protein [Ktedonosporobacter rubrisoli]QBD74775.1 TetR family transcriptional regulator [Ktedonosporobacter rubrisoli]